MAFRRLGTIDRAPGGPQRSGHAEPRADFLRAIALRLGQLAEPLELVGGVHRGAGYVFVEADFGGIVGRIQPAAHRLGFLDLLALGAQQHR